VTSPIIPNVTNAPVRRPGDGQTGTFYRPQLNAQNPVGGRTAYRGTAGPVQVVLAGPFFSTMAPPVAGMLDEMKFAVASQALADVQYNLDRSIRHSTPYYETQVMVQQRMDDWVVHDRGIAYGPWLEGTSSRNNTTRFKGYASFRRAVQSTEQKAPRILGVIAQRFVNGVNQ
jgi:hypothetical protein